MNTENESFNMLVREETNFPSSISLTIQFSPVITWPLLYKFSRWKFYPIFFFSSIIILFIIFLYILRQYPNYGILSILSLFLFFMTCELTKIDRKIIKTLFYHFEFYFLIIQILIYSISGIFTELTFGSKDAYIIGTYVYFLIGYFSLFLFEAYLLYDRTKLVARGISVLNVIRIFIQDIWFPTNSSYATDEFCHVYCTTIENLLLSTLFQILVFNLKYLILSSDSVDRFVVINRRLSYAFWV